MPGKLLFSVGLGCWLGLFVSLNAHGQTTSPRGIWWWTSPENPWGTEQVIGNAAKEADVLKFAQAWNIGRFYNCFSEQTSAQPGLIRSWNEQVHAAGMSSQLLLGENTWIFPSNRPNLLTIHIQRELIEFNAAATNPKQRFDGLHLDIEPHGLPGWKTMSPIERKKLLLQLRDTFMAVRTYLDEHGCQNIPVFADLPVWYDQVGKPVGWESAAERNAWFADLGQSLAGISLMAYERNTAPRIESGVIWELQNFKGTVRVGLEASVGPDKNQTWKTFGELIGMIRTQERAVPPRAVDIHDFSQFYDLSRRSDTNAAAISHPH